MAQSKNDNLAVEDIAKSSHDDKTSAGKNHNATSHQYDIPPQPQREQELHQHDENTQDSSMDGFESDEEDTIITNTRDFTSFQNITRNNMQSIKENDTTPSTIKDHKHSRPSKRGKECRGCTLLKRLVEYLEDLEEEREDWKRLYELKCDKIFVARRIQLKKNKMINGQQVKINFLNEFRDLDPNASKNQDKEEGKKRKQ